jgi:carbamoyltransferase
MNILGISCFYHDAAAALVRDGKILAAAQEERFTRKRHDQSFPINAIRYVLREGGLGSSQIDAVAFYDKPLLKFERILETYLAFAPRGIRSFLQALPVWLDEKLWMKSLIQQQLGYKGTMIFPEHHMSHAASAFYPSPFYEAAVLTVDGVGEWSTTTYGTGRGAEIKLLKEIRFPHSLGLLYSAFTYFTGFKVNSGEYKVMGLAPYGEPVYTQKILDHLIDIKPDGSFRLNMDYFDYCTGLTMCGKKFEELFDGPARKPETKLTQREMDLARSVQDVTELVMLRMARHLRRQTGLRHLCLAGGVALNCVANGKILAERIFDDIWIQPAAGDAGGAIGAALAGWHQYYENPRTVPEDGTDFQHGSYLGPEYSDEEIQKFLSERGLPFERLTRDQVPRRVAEILAQENVVGWFSGRMEFGPRALGARSILGDPRSPRMQSVMNLKIKFRESFRPFAPTVLREKVADWFELNSESPYMLLVAPVRGDKRLHVTPNGHWGIEKLNQVRSLIPAVTHVDYSARVQTIRREDHPAYYELIAEFEKLTGCPVLVNTSFNVRGEPIVCTPEDAYRCFMRTNMDYLLLGNFLLKKTEQPALVEAKDWRKEFQLD